MKVNFYVNGEQPDYVITDMTGDFTLDIEPDLRERLAKAIAEYAACREIINRLRGFDA